MKDTRNLSSLIVGQVKDRALMEIKDGDHQLFMRIVEKRMIYRRMPVVYKVDKKTGCWICLSHVGTPYPHIKVQGKNLRLNRIMYEAFTGIVPGKGHVLHKCDNPECINPGHLYLGTAKDNVRDWMERGKSPCRYKPKRLLRKRVSARDYWINQTTVEGQQAQNCQGNTKPS